MLFARLASGLALTNADFVVIYRQCPASGFAAQQGSRTERRLPAGRTYRMAVSIVDFITFLQFVFDVYVNAILSNRLKTLTSK